MRKPHTYNILSNSGRTVMVVKLPDKQRSPIVLKPLPKRKAANVNS